MKRKICLVLVLALVCAQMLAVPAFAAYLPGDTIVYITATGNCYHKKGCGYLRSRIETTLAEAVNDGYRPCSRCHPGHLDPNGQPPEPSSAVSPSPDPSQSLPQKPSTNSSPSTKTTPPSPSAPFDLGELPSLTPFDSSKLPSYPVIESKSPSSDASQKKIEPPTDVEMIIAVLGFLVLLGLSASVLIKQSFERYDQKQKGKENRRRALEQERQEMILRRTREAEDKRLAEQQAIDRQRREEEARRLAEQQAIEQQRRKDEIRRLIELLNVAKQRREEKDKRIAEQRFTELQRKEEERKFLAEQEAFELQYHEENARLREEQRIIEQQDREAGEKFRETMPAMAQIREGKTKNQKRGRRRTYEEKRAEYAKIYGGVPAEQLAGVPMWVEIGPDGLPKERDAHGFGDYFTYYITAHGKCIHKKRGCCGANIPIHVLNARARFMSYCSKCCPWPYPDLRWYSKYLKIKQIKQKYNID